MSSYELGLLLHLLGVLLLFGGMVVAGVLFESARRRARPSEIALLLGVARIGAGLVAVGTVLLLGAGLWLASEVEQLGSAWILTSLAIFCGTLALGALGGQQPKRARRLATRLDEQGDDMNAELRRLLDDRLSLAANYAASALVLVVLVLMVWQPGR